MVSGNNGAARTLLGADIGGTFTDVVLEHRGARSTTKVLTTHDAPERGVLDGIARVLEAAGASPGDVDLFVHGTTLATNAIIERKGARTAFVTTEGFRDSIEIAYENRFDQYDIFIEKPSTLVPRKLRYTIPERIDAAGKVRLALDEKAVAGLCDVLGQESIDSVAVGFLHSYANPAHERRTGEIIREHLPDITITLSSDVSPEAREYERFSTACANAYVQPLIAQYLGRLEDQLKASGFRCPMLLMSSGGGLVTVESARAYPIRLVESGPAGGAILASHIAKQMGLDSVLSFDMGGTTAKICLIDDGKPHLSRDFEVDRRYRFLKGSGLPLRIPVIEMVEIGAGGGSIAHLDALKRIKVGPESAGSEPGPSCYGRGGDKPTVTDANLQLGKLDPELFAGGLVRLQPELSERAVTQAFAGPLGLDAVGASRAICAVVEENMANAARVHAVDRGKELSDRVLVAFGGAAPLHAAHLAQKLGIRRVVVPADAGVGSAVGFLRAPISFQVARSCHMRLDRFQPEELSRVFDELRTEAFQVVAQGAPGMPITEFRQVDMRYSGQGHEITISLPVADYDAASPDDIARTFEASYQEQFGRIIPGMTAEITSCTLLATAVQPYAPQEKFPRAQVSTIVPKERADVFDEAVGAFQSFPVYNRAEMKPGTVKDGPALIVEEGTTTIVPRGASFAIDDFDAIVLTLSKNNPVGKDESLARH